MLAWLFFGCSLKSGVTMLQMDQQYDALGTTENREAKFEWAMAEEYRNKAKEEYAASQFEDAEMLAAEAVSWMEKAAQKSSGGEPSSDDSQSENGQSTNGAEQ